MDKSLARGLVNSLIRTGEAEGRVFWEAFDALIGSLSARTRSGRRIQPEHFNGPASAFISAISQNPYVVKADLAPMAGAHTPGRLTVYALFTGKLKAPGREPEELYVVREIDLQVRSRRWTYDNRMVPVSVSWHLLRRFAMRNEADWGMLRNDLSKALPLVGAWLHATRELSDNAATFACQAERGALIGQRLLCTTDENNHFVMTGAKGNVLTHSVKQDLPFQAVSFRTFLDTDKLQPCQAECLDLVNDWSHRFVPDYVAANPSPFLAPSTAVPPTLDVPLIALGMLTSDERWREAFRGRVGIATNPTVVAGANVVRVAHIA